MMKRVFLCVMVGGTLGFLAARMIPLSSTEKVGMKRDSLGYLQIQSVQDICAVYPKTVQEIQQRCKDVQEQAQKLIEGIISCPEDQNKETMLRTYDRIYNYLRVEYGLLELVKSVHPDEQMREEAEKQYIALDAFWTEQV